MRDRFDFAGDTGSIPMHELAPRVGMGHVPHEWLNTLEQEGTVKGSYDVVISWMEKLHARWKDYVSAQ